MRKKVKIITEEIHEHGVIALDIPLYHKLLNISNLDSVNSDHVDLMVERVIKISEEEEGGSLCMDHLPKIIDGIPTV